MTWHKVPQLKEAVKECVEMLLRAVEARDERIAQLESEAGELKRRIEAGQRCVSDLEMQKISLNHRIRTAESEAEQSKREMKNAWDMAAYNDKRADAAEAKLRAVESLLPGWREGDYNLDAHTKGVMYGRHRCAAELEAKLKEQNHG